MTEKPVMTKRKKESSQRRRPLIRDCIIAREIVYNAYKEGFIKWNIYSLALERIKRTMNGTWMFKKSDNRKQK